MSSILAIIFSAVVGLGTYVLGRLYGARVADWFQRRTQAQTEAVKEYFDRTFKEVSLTRCRLIVLGCAVLGATVGYVFTPDLGLKAKIGFSLVFAIVGWRVPKALAGFLYKRWVRRFDDQLVDALTLVANALRSGLSLVQALDLVSKEMPAPISLEMGLTLNEHKMGTRLDDSLERMAERLPSPDLGIVVDAVLILRETGGNLSEVFDTIVYTISERKKVEGKIRSLTAMGVTQGVILIAMPFVLGYALHILNPDYMRPLFSTLLGWIMILFMCLMLFAGGMMIRKIVKIEV